MYCNTYGNQSIQYNKLLFTHLIDTFLHIQLVLNNLRILFKFLLQVFHWVFF